MRNVVALAVLLLALVSGGSAQAHKVVASVYAEGDVIEGEIGFSNGDMAPADTLVEIFDQTMAKIGEARTDKDGTFRYRPAQRVPLVFRADLGGGHVAEARMSVDELPGDELPGDELPGDELPGADGGTASTAPTRDGDGPAAVAASADMRAMIAEAVRDEVKPLRREIAAYKEKNDLQAVLGGIGYIVGLFGIGFYLAARGKLRQA